MDKEYVIKSKTFAIVFVGILAIVFVLTFFLPQANTDLFVGAFVGTLVVFGGAYRDTQKKIRNDVLSNVGGMR